MKNNSEKKRHISKKLVKNSIILVVIFILCFGFTLYLCEWYKVYDDYQKEVPVIRGTLSEIVPEDLDHYVVDIPNMVIYACTASDDKCRNFEKDFKKYVNKNDIADSVVYLNLSGIDQQQFINDFNEKYDFKIKLTDSYPAFISFKDGNVDAILQGNSDKPLTISNVDSFLDMNISK